MIGSGTLRGPALAKALIMVALMIVLRALLPANIAAGHVASFTWAQLAILDFVIIALTPPLIVGWGQPLAQRTNLLVWCVSLSGFLLYERFAAQFPLLGG